MSFHEADYQKVRKDPRRVNSQTWAIRLADGDEMPDLRETKEFKQFCDMVRDIIAGEAAGMQGATYRSIKAVLEYRLTMAIDTLLAQGRIDREQFGLIDRFTEAKK